MTHTNLTLAVANKLERHPQDVLFQSPRNLNILRHYQAQLDTGRMGYEQARDRAITDLRGNNYHTEREQYSELKGGY